jgi:hypothetical protein
VSRIKLNLGEGAKIPSPQEINLGLAVIKHPQDISEEQRKEA